MSHELFSPQRRHAGEEMNEKISLWEIFVPVTSNDEELIDAAYHRIWDEHVRSLSGGLTLLRSVTGQWVNADKKVYVEKMIPVRIACDEQTIEKIADFTAHYYHQEAVMYYEISQRVFVRQYDDR
jgi:hypothetical protein